MTALAAVLRVDGGCCTPAELEAMLEVARHHGPDRRLCLDGPAGLGQVDRRCPAVESSTSGCQIAFSGRLHERVELARLLRMGGHLNDPELVLAAYENWDEECVRHLLGEFAFVIWHPGLERLVAARDAMGTRTLFYGRVGNAWAVASECGQLGAHPEQVTDPDPDALHRLLAMDFEDLGATFWRGLRRLPPAHVLVLDSRGPRPRRYWQPDPRAEVHCATDGEYVERFRSLFLEAVRCRIEGPEPVGCLFSGGVDSSAVLAAARAVAADGDPPLEAFSMAFAAAPVDDRPFIDALRRPDGSGVHYVPPPPMAPVRGLEAAIRRMHGPFVDAHHQVVDALLSACAAEGCRVVLTGLRGDDIFGGLDYLADRLRGLRLRGLRAELEAWSAVVGVGASRLFPALCLRPWLPRPGVLTRLASRPAIMATRSQRRRPGFGSLAREQAYELALGPFTTLTTELFELSAASRGLVPAYPFWDRRLVEFVLALPQEMRATGGVTKRVLRDAMTGVAPAANMQRVDKLTLSPFFRRGLMHEDRSLVIDALSHLHPTLGRVVSQDRATRVLRDLLGGREVPLLQVWFLLCANLWLRQTGVEPGSLGRLQAVTGRGASDSARSC